MNFNAHHTKKEQFNMFRVCLILVMVLFATSTFAESSKLTVAEALSLLSALRNLDGHIVQTKLNGTDTAVVIPWEFGSGTLRLRLMSDLNILAGVEKSANDARLSIIKEISSTGISPNTPEADKFQIQYGEVLNAPAPGVADLSRIKASELRLDKNEIPITTLSALMPILDIDIPLK